MNWEDKTEVKKGNVGEEIVDSWLLENGYIPYKPIKGIAHPFDRLCASKDKKKIFIADSKAKPARTYYPDTGIDVKVYNEYRHIRETYSVDVFLFFVDEDAGTVYGNTLDELDKERAIFHNGIFLQYPLVHKGIRYFPVDAMETIGLIPKDKIDKLKEYSTRNPIYIISETERK